MSTLPSGTVSLLFSDVEGSTVLLSRLWSAYAGALDGQRRVLRRAWAAHGGTELGTEGDSFFVVFPTSEGAVGAAAEAQRGLALYPWPGGERVRVRIGIHTGSRGCMTVGMWAWMCIGRLGSRVRLMAGR
jgi:class 3 adenylate cyclase